MSTETMKSTEANARSSRRASGVDTTGLPATVIIARICPSPGVSISSASVATGYSPKNSGSPFTRLCRRPNFTPRPVPVGFDVGPADVAGWANIIPPSRSRLPARMLTTSTSHDATVPNSCVQVPIRP